MILIDLEITYHQFIHADVWLVSCELKMSNKSTNDCHCNCASLKDFSLYIYSHLSRLKTSGRKADRPKRKTSKCVLLSLLFNERTDFDANACYLFVGKLRKNRGLCVPDQLADKLVNTRKTKCDGFLKNHIHNSTRFKVILS